MDLKDLIAPCGLVCGDCPMHLAKDSPGLKISLSDRLGIPMDKVACDCCREEKGVIGCNGKTAPCDVYSCSREKTVQFCCDCADFPCSRYQPYADRASEVPHNLKMFNLGLIKKLGVEEFAESHARQTRESYFKGKMK